MNAHTKIKQYCCPACGSPVGEAVDLATVRTAITSHSKVAIFDALSRKRGEFMSADDLMDRVFGAGIHDDRRQVFASQMCQLRREIERYGWTVSHGRGGGRTSAKYRLIPTEMGA
jgi:DNA-binding response OmpR family regulator